MTELCGCDRLLLPHDREPACELAETGQPLPCPSCGRPMGDADRAVHGRCPLCRTTGRRARSLTVPR